MEEKEEKRPENVGVINPYALVEVILNKKVNWSKIDNPREMLKKALEMEYDKLFDPKFNSPLYTGLKYKPDTKRMIRIKIPDTASAPHRAIVYVAPSTVWVDPGDYFQEGCEMTDPIQGAVADCYLIAALSSVAWARTYTIAHKSRNLDDQGKFIDMVPFYDAGNLKKIEVTEKLPMRSPGNLYKFARSNDPGEIWPAIYEKAYAKWKTNHVGDTPDIPSIAYGNPVGATAALTGLTPYYYWTSDLSPNEIWSQIRQNCLSRKTFNPMVAWTYSSADAAPDVINYSDANLVANHAYSILGWQYANNQKYIVLRNPWGSMEATMNIDGGVWMAWDAPYYSGPGFWRIIDMATGDGIFALRVDTFKKYFSGFGLVKESI